MRHIHTITPSDDINRQLMIYAMGKTTWSDIRRVIVAEVEAGRFHPDTDPELIKQVTDAHYGTQPVNGCTCPRTYGGQFLRMGHRTDCQ